LLRLLISLNNEMILNYAKESNRALFQGYYPGIRIQRLEKFKKDLNKPSLIRRSPNGARREYRSEALQTEPTSPAQCFKKNNKQISILRFCALYIVLFLFKTRFGN
jgi:hypothetical protein